MQIFEPWHQKKNKIPSITVAARLNPAKVADNELKIKKRKQWSDLPYANSHFKQF